MFSSSLTGRNNRSEHVINNVFIPESARALGGRHYGGNPSYTRYRTETRKTKVNTGKDTAKHKQSSSCLKCIDLDQ